jgi:hypothetical protein
MERGIVEMVNVIVLIIIMVRIAVYKKFENKNIIK